jgi:hypothetical protein
LCGFHSQFPITHLARTSVNYQSDFRPNISSTPELCAYKLPVKKLLSLEQSFQAVTISEKKSPAASSHDMQSLIAQKKELQSEIASTLKEMEKLKVSLI